MGGTLIKVDIGHGRGWLAPAPAASLRRIDAQLGRFADINEAGRSPEQANTNRRKWLAYERYLNGGPWAPKAPYALGANQSVHCWGYAADTDDWYNNAAAAVWRNNGWRQTARYPGNTAKDEPWHGEYSEHLDTHRNDPAPSGGGTAPTIEEGDMLTTFYGVQSDGSKPDKDRVFEIFRDPRTGELVKRHISVKTVMDAIKGAHAAAGLKTPIVGMTAAALNAITTWKK